MDISVTVPRLPGPGSTVLGSAARFSPGGKGANQAVAAARLGADVRMVGCVADDDLAVACSTRSLPREWTPTECATWTASRPDWP